MKLPSLISVFYCNRRPSSACSNRRHLPHPILVNSSLHPNLIHLFLEVLLFTIIILIKFILIFTIIQFMAIMVLLQEGHRRFQLLLGSSLVKVVHPHPVSRLVNSKLAPPVISLVQGSNLGNLFSHPLLCRPQVNNRQKFMCYTSRIQILEPMRPLCTFMEHLMW